MLSHRRAYAATLAAVTLVLGSAVAGCSDSGGSAARSPLVPLTRAAYTASRPGSGPPSAEEMRQTAERLRKRAAALGLQNTDVAVDGSVITIVAPRGTAERIPSITTTARLEFRPVLDPATAAQFGLKAAYDAQDCIGIHDPSSPPAERPIVACEPSSHPAKYLLGPVALGGTEVRSASAHFDSVNGNGWMVDLDFTSAGSSTFARVTGTLAQHPAPTNQFAIVVDGNVLSAPSVPAAITGGKAQISGSFTKEAAQNLAAAISSGALPVRLSPKRGTSTS